MPSSCSLPANRLKDSLPQLALLISISLAAISVVNFCAPRPHSFLFREKLTEGSDRPADLCSRYHFNCLRTKLIFRFWARHSSQSWLNLPLASGPPVVSSAARRVRSFRAGVFTSFRPVLTMTGVRFCCGCLTTHAAISFTLSFFSLAIAKLILFLHVVILSILLWLSFVCAIKEQLKLTCMHSPPIAAKREVFFCLFWYYLSCYRISNLLQIFHFLALLNNINIISIHRIDNQILVEWWIG